MERNTLFEDPLYLKALAVDSRLKLRDFMSELHDDFVAHNENWICKNIDEYFDCLIKHLSKCSCGENWQAFAVLFLIPKHGYDAY